MNGAEECVRWACLGARVRGYGWKVKDKCEVDVACVGAAWGYG